LILSPVDASLETLGDPVRLAQIVENLLVNAAKYTPDGGRIEVAADAEGATVAISVRDSGIGIAPEMLAHVFDLFAQADTSLDRSEGGLGIGLTLVDRLSRLHGGEVQAFSSGLGHGSTFTVRLPRLAVQAPVPEPDRETIASVPKRVLLIDDNVDSAEMLKALLEFSGHSVRIAFEGTEGERAALDFLPDVILLDIGLPGKDGYQVIKSLRSLAPLASTVIVATTGYGRVEDRSRCLAAGFDEHLTKPVDTAKLQQLIVQLSARPAR